MTPLAEAMHYAFGAIWIAAMVTWIIGAAHFLPVWWSLVRKRKPDRRKVMVSLICAAIFVALIAAGFGVGGIAETAGGWG